VDPIRDKEVIDMELQLKDLETVESRAQKVKKAAKTGDKDAVKAVGFYEKVTETLEAGHSARSVQLTESEIPMMRELQLLTAKPVMYVCNVEETAVITGNEHVENVRKIASAEGASVMIIGAAIEADIAELDDQEERTMFLADIGLEEAGVAKLIRKAYELLQLQTYFTAGEKEVRAWTFPQGATAPQAAGVIHTDFEKGFIRAEVMNFADFVDLGSEVAVKEAGKLSIEGKEYLVQDGDIMHFRFNV
jgi:GTP-binding protein YchF